MATRAWDRVPVYGWYQKADGTPDPGPITFAIVGAPNGVKRVDGRAIYRAGASLTVQVGNTEQHDVEVRNRVRQALRDRDQAAAEALDLVFDGTAWDVAWDAALPSMVCTSFYAQDDPDITPQGWQIKVEEKVGGKTSTYPVTLTLAMIEATPVPGLNLADVELPPGTPSAPQPSYAKGQPGGIASLDADGRVPLAQLPAGLGGGGSPGEGSGQFTSYGQVTELPGYPSSFPPGSHTHPASQVSDSTVVGRGVMTASTPAAARSAIGAGTSDLQLGTGANTAKRGDYVPALAEVTGLEEALAGKAATGHTHTSAQVSDFTEAVQDAVAALLQGSAGVSVTYDDANNTLTLSGGGSGGLDAEAVRDTIGVALLGTGNITVTANDAADTITITTTATVNASDAALRDRSTHTGEQEITTVTGLQAALNGKQPAGSYATSQQLTDGLAGKSGTGHTHTVSQVTGAVAGLNGVAGLWQGTQAQYDAIVSKDPAVVYVVAG